MKKYLILFVIINLTACSTLTSTEKKYQNELRSILKADEEYEITLLRKKGLSTWQTLKKEKLIWPKAVNKCFSPYKIAIKIALENNKKSISPKQRLIRGYKKSLMLETALPNCLKPLGVSGRISYNNNGRTYNTPQYLNLVISKFNQRKTTSIQKKNSRNKIFNDITSSFARNMLISMRGSPRYKGNNKRYNRCSDISKSEAIFLLSRGHRYLDRDNDGDPCE